MKIRIEKLFQDVPFTRMAYFPAEGANGNKLIVGLGHSFKCDYCKKQFEIFNPTLYAYKIKEHRKVQTFCSWNCMCKYRKEKEANGKRRKAQKI